VVNVLLVTLAASTLILVLGLVLLWRRLQRRSAELRGVRHEQDLILGSISDNVTYLDRELKVVWANWSKRDGHPALGDPCAGKICHQCVAGRPEPCGGCPVPQVMATRVAADGEVTFPGGQIMRVCAAPVLDEAGELVGVVQTMRDITEMRRMADRLKHAQKMEAVGQLAAGVAHDFNNSLQVILGYAEILADSLPAGTPERSFLDPVLRAGRQSRDVVKQLLTFSRKQAPTTESFDLGERVTSQMDVLCRLVGSPVQITVDAPSNLPQIVADPSQVEQVLLNLCVNARDAMPQGGQLNIALQAIDLDPPEARRRGAPSAGSFVELLVTDQGMGIPAEIRDRIFDPFFTTKSVDRGTGLGLTTVYGIVRAHHGYLEVDSVEGEGTTLRIGWPASDTLRPLAMPDEPVLPAVAAASILVVEDDPGVQELAQAILEGDGHTVELVHDGHQALDRLLQGGDRFDLVIMDVMLPGMNGWAVYRRAQSQVPDLRVVFCSGHSPALLESEYKLGFSAQQFLQKPYRPRELLLRVRSILGDQAAGMKAEG